MNARKFVFAVLLVLIFSMPLLAQPPRDGACFYRSENYTGRSFCVGVGQAIDHLEHGFEGGIYSVQLFGQAEAIVFNYPGFAGVNVRIQGSSPNLRAIPVADNPSKNWAGRIRSVQVNFRPEFFRRGRELRWGRMEVPRSGACFYRGPGFEGDYFCMATGEGYDSLPPGFNDAILSVRVFGGANVVAFNDPGYTGLRIRFERDVPDLRQWRTQDNPYKNWGDRISSIHVLGSGWEHGNWHPDRDRDDHDWDRRDPR